MKVYQCSTTLDLKTSWVAGLSNCGSKQCAPWEGSVVVVVVVVVIVIVAAAVVIMISFVIIDYDDDVDVDKKRCFFVSSAFSGICSLIPPRGASEVSDFVEAFSRSPGSLSIPSLAPRRIDESPAWCFF